MKPDEDEFESGYARLMRSRQFSEWFQDDAAWKLASLIEMKVTYRERAVPIQTGRGSTTLILKPGQTIFGRHKWAKRLGWDASKTRRKLEQLQRMGFIDVDPQGHFSIITIRDWPKYNKSTNGQPNSQNPANQNSSGTHEQQTDYDDHQRGNGQPNSPNSATQRPPNGHPTATQETQISILNHSKEDGRSEGDRIAYKPASAKAKEILGEMQSVLGTPLDIEFLKAAQEAEHNDRVLEMIVSILDELEQGGGGHKKRGLFLHKYRGGLEVIKATELEVQHDA